LPSACNTMYLVRFAWTGPDRTCCVFVASSAGWYGTIRHGTVLVSTILVSCPINRFRPRKTPYRPVTRPGCGLLNHRARTPHPGSPSSFLSMNARESSAYSMQSVDSREGACYSSQRNEHGSRSRVRSTALIVLYYRLLRTGTRTRSLVV